MPRIPGPTPQAPAGQRFKKLNWLRAGIMAADKLLTVSPNYATEISSGEWLLLLLLGSLGGAGICVLLFI